VSPSSRIFTIITLDRI